LQPRERAGVGVDVAGDDGETDVVALEELGKPCEIGELPREPIDAVDDDAEDIPLFDAPKQLRQPRVARGSRRSLPRRRSVRRLGTRIPRSCCG
jgi:hypothetical protein